MRVITITSFARELNPREAGEHTYTQVEVSGSWLNYNNFENTSEWDKKGEEWSKLRIKNASLFLVERFLPINLNEKYCFILWIVFCFFF